LARILPELRKRQKKAKHGFPPGEVLDRRCPTENYADGKLDYESLDMPDMSVNRTFEGRKKDIARLLIELAPEDRSWGVCGFKTNDIPGERYQNGISYRMKPVYRPLKKNPYHSEIWAFRNGIDHIPKGDPEIPIGWWMKWQVDLCRKVFIEIPAE
jgi:hypothetical protein